MKTTIARKALSNGQRVLMVTHSPDGPAYGLDTGQGVSAASAATLQADLFVRPNEDGLFPGFSQTWKAEG